MGESPSRVQIPLSPPTLLLMTNDFSNFMRIALEQAQLAASIGEVPVGAVVARENKIISSAHNRMEADKDASAHAEILAIRAASKELANWRLEDCVLCVTLEPCTMCLGAIKQARIPTVVFGASDPRLGACGSLYDLSIDPRNGPVPRIISGFEQEKCSALLKDFFSKIRQ